MRRRNSNATANPATFPYQALCQQTVKHTWVITDGMAAAGGTQLKQGESLSRCMSYSQSLQAVVSVPANSSATYQTYFDQRPIANLPFEVDIKIGGSFRFEAFRGHTRANFTQGLGTFYKANPNPHAQVIDDQFVTAKLHGQYTGAIGKTPGNFTCEAIATP